MKFLLFILATILLAPGPVDQKKTIGVGFVPQADGQGDVTEDMLFRFVGEIPQVDQMFTIDDSVHMLRTLVKIKAMGRKVDTLVMAGHGSRDNPGFIWRKDPMLPEELDLNWNKAINAQTKRWLADPVRVSKSKKEVVEEWKKTVRETDERIVLLPQLKGLMAPDARILLINCSAAATQKGVNWVLDMGRLLMGDEGGQITASSNDIVLREVGNIYEQIGQALGNGGFKNWGEPLIRGNWVTYGIRAKGKTTTSPVKKPATKPTTPNKKPAIAKGTFGLVQKIFGKAPGPVEVNGGRLSGSMTENQFSVQAEWYEPYEGTIQVVHNFKRGNLKPTLTSGDIVELEIVSIAAESGKDKHNVGSGASWYIEGSAEVLEQGKTFAGRASNGQFYPASSGRVRFKVGSGGTIKIMAGHGGQVWGSSDNWNPVTYIFKYGAPATEKMGVGQ